MLDAFAPEAWMLCDVLERIHYLSVKTLMSQALDIAVEFQDVSFRINRRLLLSNLNLTIYSGEALVLLGRSGSGKTTTLKLVNHLLMPTTGQVLVQGRSTTAWDAIQLRRRIGYVIQDIGLFPHFSVGQNIGLVPSLEKWAPQRIEARVDEMLDLVGLDPKIFAGRYPHQLSGGQRQRIGVARALAAEPPILLMDEPFGALDPITRLELQQQFRQLQQQLGKTVVFVTHDIQEAFFLATRIGLMHEGNLVFLGTKAEFLKSQHPEAKAFIACLNAGNN
ncbi:MAG: ATP-binding cassette domain-containing protein [Geitlerinemataceae cyanobacterium]